MLFAGLETLKGNPVRQDSLESVFIPVIDNLSRSSRDLAYWNRVTNKFNQYEYVNEPLFKIAQHFYIKILLRARRGINSCSNNHLLYQLRNYYLNKSPEKCHNRRKILRTITRMIHSGQRQYISFNKLDC